uniref:Uncharacterized protein n=1 Tax=Onchocerca volvulus TaxID=6282 RepID=A0A8R1Y1X4_ONCVO
MTVLNNKLHITELVINFVHYFIRQFCKLHIIDYNLDLIDSIDKHKKQKNGILAFIESAEISLHALSVPNKFVVPHFEFHQSKESAMNKTHGIVMLNNLILSGNIIAVINPEITSDLKY